MSVLKSLVLTIVEERIGEYWASGTIAWTQDGVDRFTRIDERVALTSGSPEIGAQAEDILCGFAVVVRKRLDSGNYVLDPKPLTHG